MSKEHTKKICLFIPDGMELYNFGRDTTPGYAKLWWVRLMGFGVAVISPRCKPYGFHVRLHAGQKTIWQRWFYR